MATGNPETTECLGLSISHKQKQVAIIKQSHPSTIHLLLPWICRCGSWQPPTHTFSRDKKCHSDRERLHRKQSGLGGNGGAVGCRARLKSVSYLCRLSAPGTKPLVGSYFMGIKSVVGLLFVPRLFPILKIP